MFHVPAAGTLGDMSKTLLRGPGVNNFDIALFKNFALREWLRAQFRVEGYNAFNHTQFSTFDSTARFDANGNQVNGQFGQFTAAANPRQLQLALEHLEANAKNKKAAYENILWALINTKEFVFNQ